ncbi:MAG: hypothetical protein AAGA03_18050, partial [Planctomycetota bacterium]
VGSVMAFVLGIAQTASDRDGGARALLLQRALTATQWYWGKLVAGLTMQLTAIVGPLLGLAAYFAWDDRQTIAFRPVDLVPSYAMAVGSFLLWPASVLLVQRSDRFWGTRVLPVVTSAIAVWLLGASVYLTSDPLIWLVIFAAFAVPIAIAAWRHFESPVARSFSARSSLWMVNTVALLSLIGLAGTFATAQYSSRMSRLMVTIGADGRAWLCDQQSNGVRREMKYAPLDQSRSAREALTSDLAMAPTAQWALNRGGITRYPRSMRPLGTLRADQQGNGQLRMIFDDASQEVLVYRRENGHTQLRQRMTPEEGSFGEFFALANPTLVPMQNALDYSRPASMFQQVNSSTELIGCRNGLFEIDIEGRRVTKLASFDTFNAPKDVKYVFTSQPGGSVQAFLVSNRVFFVDTQPVVTQMEQRSDGQQSLPADDARGDANPNKSSRVTQVILPKVLSDAQAFRVAKMPDKTGQYVALTHPASVGSLRKETIHWFRFDREGELLEQESYHETLGFEPPPKDRISPAAFVPPLGFGVASLIGWIGSGTNRVWESTLKEFLSSPEHVLWLLGNVVLAISILLLVRRRFVNVALWWLVPSVLMGPAASLAVVTVHRRRDLHACHACGKRTWVNEVSCQHCGASDLDRPSRGIEILGKANRTREVAAAAV